MHVSVGVDEVAVLAVDADAAEAIIVDWLRVAGAMSAL